MTFRRHCLISSIFRHLSFSPPFLMGKHSSLSDLNIFVCRAFRLKKQMMQLNRRYWHTLTLGIIQSPLYIHMATGTRYAPHTFLASGAYAPFE